MSESDSKKSFDFLLSWIEENFDSSVFSSSTGQCLDFPDFDHMPYEFIEYAVEELSSPSQRSLINAIKHIKTAVECQLDTFLFVLGFTRTKNAKPQQLPFPAKMELIKQLGILRADSLERFNRLRNKIEHDYKKPDDENIDSIKTYLDLADAIIIALDGQMQTLASYSDIDFADKDPFGTIILRAGYSCENGVLSFGLSQLGREIVIRLDEKEKRALFLEGLRLYFLLTKSVALISPDSVISIWRKHSRLNSGQ